MISMRAGAVGAQQHDLGAPDMLLRRVAVSDQRPQAATIGRRNGEGYSCAHAPNSHARSKRESQTGLYVRQGPLGRGSPLALWWRQLRLGQHLGAAAAEAAVLAVAGEDREPGALVEPALAWKWMLHRFIWVASGASVKTRAFSPAVADMSRGVCGPSPCNPLRCCRPCGRNRQPERNASSRTHRVRRPRG